MKAKLHPREVIEACGAVFVQKRGNWIKYRDPVSKKLLTVFLSACTRDNIESELRRAREGGIPCPQ